MELPRLTAEEFTAISVEGVKPIPQERVLSNTAGQIVAVPVSQIREETGQEIQLTPQEQVSDCVIEQTVNIPIQQMLEQTIEVAKAIPQERVDIPDVVQRQSPMVQKSQNTIETPQVQHIDKIGHFPDVQEGQTVQKTVEIPVGVSMTAQRSEPQQIKLHRKPSRIHRPSPS